jgi:hypothetical protein
VMTPPIVPTISAMPPIRLSFMPGSLNTKN